MKKINDFLKQPKVAVILFIIFIAGLLYIKNTHRQNFYNHVENQGTISDSVNSAD